MAHRLVYHAKANEISLLTPLSGVACGPGGSQDTGECCRDGRIREAKLDETVQCQRKERPKASQYERTLFAMSLASPLSIDQYEEREEEQNAECGAHHASRDQDLQEVRMGVVDSEGKVARLDTAECLMEGS
jgi:hypothetical protein